MSNNNWFVKLTVLIFLFLSYSTSFAQEKYQTAVQLLLGKWTGVIEGSVQGCLSCWYNVTNHTCPKDPPWHPFRIEIIGNRSEADMTINAKYPPVSFRARGNVGFVMNEVISILIDPGDPITIPSEALGFVVVLHNGGFKITETLNGTVKLIFGAIDKPKDMRATAEFYRVELLKKNFPKDIRPNEPIQTDKKTRVEIDWQDVGKVNVGENSSAKIVCQSACILVLAKGRISGLIKKLKPKTRFEVHTPIAVIAVRGTEFELKVEDDGTTILNVFDGEVEFSDIQNRKTVLVKKNQQSVVKSGEIPSEPVQINPNQILKWWE